MPAYIEKLQQVVDSKIARIAHSIIDGLYLSDSLIEYGSDVSSSSSENATQNKQDFLNNITDLPLLLTDISLLVAWSCIGNLARQRNDASAVETFFANNWLYVRDFLSGLKNGRKAVVNVSVIGQQLASSNWYYIANPLGIGIGVLLALNLVWYRHMDSARDAMLKQNAELLEQIINQKWEQLQPFDEIKYQHGWKNKAAYASAFLDGTTDGAYLFGCLFTIIGFGVATFPPTLLIAAIVVISFYTLCSLICKLADEYEKQLKLQRSADLCQLQLQYNKYENASLVWLAAGTTCSPNALSNYTAESRAYTELQADFDLKYNINGQISPVMRVMWAVGRGLLSGAKNGKAVIDFMAGFIKKVIVVTILTGVVGFSYAIYLGLMELCKTVRNQIDKYNTPTIVSPQESSQAQLKESSQAQFKVAKSISFGFLSSKSFKTVDDYQPIMSRSSLVPV